jgi:putative heme transporter
VNRRLARILADKMNRRTALLIALWVPALILLVAVREVLLPFLIALLLAYVIAPLVRRIHALNISGRRIPRWAAVLLLYGAFAGVLWLFGAVFVPQLYREAVRMAKDGTELINDLDDQRIAAMGHQVEDWFERYSVPVTIITPGDAPNDGANGARGLTIDIVKVTQDLVRDAKSALFAESRRLLAQIQAVVTWVLRLVFQTFLVLMLTAFIAADTERIFSFFFSITPLRDRSRLQELLGRIDRGLSGVVRGQLTICLINGGLTLVGLLLLGVKFAFLLATLASVFSLVPIFGSILSTIPIVIVALSGGPKLAVLALLWIVAIHALEANLLNPKIMGDAAKIHPVLVMLALIIGEHFYGIVGALLAVPIMSIVVTIFKSARQKAMQLDAEIHEAPPPVLAPAAPSPTRRRVSLTDGG